MQPRRGPVRPELVVSVGPASYGLVSELASAGATAFRLNSSHLRTRELAQVAGRVRDLAPSIPLVIDLQGAKMRLGWFAARTVVVGQTVRFVVGESESESGIPLPHPELFDAVEPGETISIDDGRVLVRIDSVDRGALRGECLQAGSLGPRKGVNRGQHPVEASDLCEADLRAIESTLALAPAYAISFVRDGSEIAWVRSRAPGARVVAKVERAEALRSMPGLAEKADALWICRGDLGAQLGLPALARAVARIDPRTLGSRPVLMAGQVLEHLTHHSQPTRSEVCHLADLVDRGYAGIVLSDETAIGVDPVRAVAITAELLNDL